MSRRFEQKIQNEGHDRGGLLVQAHKDVGYLSVYDESMNQIEIHQDNLDWLIRTLNQAKGFWGGR